MNIKKHLLVFVTAMLTLTAAAQQKAYRGVVVDDNGEAVIGATIKLKKG